MKKIICLILSALTIHTIIGMEKENKQKISQKILELIKDRKKLEEEALVYVLRSLDKPLTIKKVANEYNK